MKDIPFEDEEKSAKPGKTPVKQVLLGFQVLRRDGIAKHEKALEEGLAKLREPLKQTIAARRSGQAQIKGALSLLRRDLQQIAKMKHSVNEQEIETFVQATDPVCRSIEDLIQSTKRVLSTVYVPEDSVEEEKNSESERLISHSPQLQYIDREGDALAQENEELRREAETIEEINQQMQTLQEIMIGLNNCIAVQAEHAERLESCTLGAVENVREGEAQLSLARHYKTAVLPAVGLTVGFAAGGPIGAIAGARVGFATSIIAGALGYAGGKIVHQFKSMKFFPGIPQID